MNIQNNLLLLFLLSFSVNFCSLSIAMDEHVAALIIDTTRFKYRHYSQLQLDQRLNTELRIKYKLLIDTAIWKKIDLNNIPNRCYPILIDVAQNGFNDLVIELIDYGANIEFRGDSGSALSIAAENGHLETVKLLLDRDANVENGHPLIEAVRYINFKTENKVSIINLLLAHDANTNATEALNFTALHHILRRSELFPAPTKAITSLVKTFIQYGADINIKNNHGDTPLSLAQRYYPELVPDILKMQEDRKIH